MAVKGLAGCCCNNCCEMVVETTICYDLLTEDPPATIDFAIADCPGYEISCTLDLYSEGIPGVGPVTYTGECDGQCVYIEFTYPALTNPVCLSIGSFAVFPSGYTPCPETNPCAFGGGGGEDDPCILTTQVVEDRVCFVVKRCDEGDMPACPQCCPTITINGDELIHYVYYCVRDEDDCLGCVRVLETDPAPDGAVSGPHSSAEQCAPGCRRVYCVDGVCQLLSCPPEGMTWDDGYDTIAECVAECDGDPPPEEFWYCGFYEEIGILHCEQFVGALPGDWITVSGPYPTSTACVAGCGLWRCCFPNEGAPHCIFVPAGEDPGDYCDGEVGAPWFTEAECEADCV